MRTKYKVFFRRVSSKGQDLSMQRSGDAPYREQYPSSEILIIEEFDVSANKLSLKERPKMMKLVSMIENNQVDVIYTFDRTRLFRDFYEGNYFVSLCRKYNVEIFYTSSNNGHQQATDSPLVEGVLNIASDLEGENIARRTEEARRRYPSQKLGYIKLKDTRHYIQDSSKSLILKEFFSDILKISTLDELQKFLSNYKKKLKTKTETLIRILSDPFYAAYDLSNGKNKLNHVEPYLTLTQYEKLQEKNSLLTSYTERISNLRELDIYQPICGICKKAMIYRVNAVEGTALYSCSRKHPKISVFIQDLSQLINNSLEAIINHFEIDELMKESKKYFSSLKNSLNSKFESIQKSKNTLLDEILLGDMNIKYWKEHPLYNDLISLGQELEESNYQVLLAEELLLDNQTIVKLLKDYLINIKESNPTLLYSMLIEKLIIYENEVKLEVKYFKYINDIPKTLIYEEGTLLWKN